VSLRIGPAVRPEEQQEFSRRPFRVGIVKEQDSAQARVRVVFEEFDQMLSYWLQVLASKTQDDKSYWMPDVGEQVVCLMDERDEAGVVLGAIYSAADIPPVDSSDKYHLAFKDDTSIEYDRVAHVLAVNFADATSIKYDAGEHSLLIGFTDGMSIGYQVATHALSVIGGPASSAIVAAPAGIVLQAGGSQVSITPSEVSITPPLPLSSTVAKT
jgi:phage baseplate assembly protein gpV